MTWTPDLLVEEIGSPQRIAPFSVAVSAELLSAGDVAASGRLILLHDPAGNESWEGTFRVVTLTRADVDLEMVTDPLLPDVAWSWLTDALELHAADHAALAGTVTASYGRGFGRMSGEAEQAEVEVRASWTPRLHEDGALTGHLSAWQELLRLVGGTPSLPPGVVQFPVRQ